MMLCKCFSCLTYLTVKCYWCASSEVLISLIRLLVLSWIYCLIAIVFVLRRFKTLLFAVLVLCWSWNPASRSFQGVAGPRSSVGLGHSRRASQQSWSRRMIPNKHGRRQDCGCWLRRLILKILGWLQQNDVTLPAACLRPCLLGKICWPIDGFKRFCCFDCGRKKSREYLI